MNMMWKVALLLLLVFTIEAYDTEGSVLLLQRNDFDKAVQDFKFLFVEFYAPWCSHCRKLAPIYSELAQTLQSTNSQFKLAKVDCTQEIRICDKFKVKGYPTLKLFINGGEPIQYESLRTKQAMYQWLQKKTEIPAHLDDKANSQQKQQQKAKINNQQKKPVAVQYAKEGHVYVLSDETLENSLQQFNLVLVKFYSPSCGYCKELAPIYADAATSLSDTASSAIMAEIDCTVYIRSCRKYKIQKYPQIILFENGKNIANYNGLRDKRSLVDFMNEKIFHALPKEMTDNTLEQQTLSEL